MADYGKMKKLMITCGGTGGHFYPGLSIARKFSHAGGEAKLLLSGVHASSQQKIAQSYGIEAIMLPKMPQPKRHFLQFLHGLFRGWLQSRKEIQEFAPDAFLAMGSFASLPAVLAAKQRRIPIFLHDGNARIGRANRFFSRFARMMGSAFPAVNAKKCRCELLTTGMPLRPELTKYQNLSKEEAILKLNELFDSNLQPAQKTLLFMGGSQGAALINQMFPKALNVLKRNDFQVLHLTGPGKLDNAIEHYRQADYPVLALEKSEEMAYFLAAADFVVARSGGSTVAELALFGKPSLLIPYSAAMEHHQDDNADYLVKAGAAKKTANRDLIYSNVRTILQKILDTKPEKLQQMHTAALTCTKPDAADAMLKEMAARL